MISVSPLTFKVIVVAACVLCALGGYVAGRMSRR
jgi:hypothetical protein